MRTAVSSAVSTTSSNTAWLALKWLVHEVAAACARIAPEAFVQRKVDIETEREGIEEFLRAVRRRYRMAAEVRLDAVAEARALSSQEQVAAVLDEVAEEHPGPLRILREHEGDPALTVGNAWLRAVIRNFRGRAAESGAAQHFI